MRKLIAGKYVEVDADGKPLGDTSAKGPKQNAAASAAQGRQDAVPAGGVKKLTLTEALKSLKPGDAAHFTKDGDPDLRVLAELTGQRQNAAIVKMRLAQMRKKGEIAW